MVKRLKKTFFVISIAICILFCNITEKSGPMKTVHAATVSKKTYDSGGKSFYQVFGITRQSLLNQLTKHVNDDYYLGTKYFGKDNRIPYGMAGSKEAKKSPYWVEKSEGKKGQEGMQCTGFVWHALYQSATKNKGKIPAYTGWYAPIVNNKITRTVYESKNWDSLCRELGKDASPGDIIWIWDTTASGFQMKKGMNVNGSNYNHVGIFCGTYFDTLRTATIKGKYWQQGSIKERWWHSSNKMPLVASMKEVSGNMTSRICPKKIMKKYVVTLIKIGGEVGPVYANAEYSDEKEIMQDVKIRIRKEDFQTKAGLEGAEYAVLCDGIEVGKAITNDDGNAPFSYQRKLKSARYQKKNQYCVNYESLTAAEKQRVQNNHIYRNYGEAYEASYLYVSQKIKEELDGLKEQSHIWSVKELRAPSRHQRTEEELFLGEETAACKEIETVFFDDLEWRRLDLKKESTNEIPWKCSLENAIYLLIAAEEIKGSDNKSCVYKEGDCVGELRTDSNGEAHLDGLYPGRYYLEEKEAPKGFSRDLRKINVDLSTQDVKIIVQDDPIVGKIHLRKYIGNEKLPEGNSVFEVHDEKGQFVCTLVTDSKGEAFSKELVFGRYTIYQVQGVEGYQTMDPVFVNIDGSMEVEYEIERVDLPEYSGIEIQKICQIDDEETNSYEKSLEKNAQFLIENKAEDFQTVVTTNEDGIAKTGELTPGEYRIKQIKGEDNFLFAADEVVRIEPDETKMYRVALIDENAPRKVRIQKFIGDGEKKIPEQNAIFLVLDENNFMMNQKELKEAVNNGTLLEKAEKEKMGIIIRTQKNGKGCALLNSIPSDHEFVIIQIQGKEGFSFCDPWYSKDCTFQEEGNAKVYEFEAVDELIDWGRIKLHKEYQVAAKEGEPIYEAEKDAKFQIQNEKGEVICQIATDENGIGISKKLPFGRYTIVQTEGKIGCYLVKPQQIVLDQEKNHQDILVEMKNDAKPILVKVEKRSIETGKLLNGARYDIFNETGDRITSLITGKEGEDGCAQVRLPFGKYQIIEVVSAEQFKISKPIDLELSYQTVQFIEGKGMFFVYEQEEPVYGKISIQKFGETLAGIGKSETSEYDAENERKFEYEEGPIEGAEYGLYAKKDIILDDGSVLWKEGTCIDRKITGKDGSLTFTRMRRQDVECEEFPIGEYYYKEEVPPPGYEKDLTIYDVFITADSVKKEGEEEQEEEDFFDEEDEEQDEQEEENTRVINGPYVLDKERFQTAVSRDANTIEFTWKRPQRWITSTDISSEQDQTVILWKEGDVVYVSTKDTEQPVIFPSDSSQLFQDFEQLEHIYFEHVKTEYVEDYSQMFEGCSKIAEIDLTNFQMKHARFVERMFCNCVSLRHIYARDMVKNQTDEELSAEPDSIVVKPLTDFIVDSPYRLECFTFFYHYPDDSTEEIVVSKEDVMLSESIASPVGINELTFFFTEQSLYRKYEMAKTKVKVLPRDAYTLQEGKNQAYRFTQQNILKKDMVKAKKTDGQEEPVSGAVFGVYAINAIKNYQGQTICKKGELITTVQTGESGSICFEELPHSIFHEGTEENLYEIREIKAPDGFKKTTQTIRYEKSMLEGIQKEEVLPTIVNEQIPYITLRKEWDDYHDRTGERPPFVKILLELPEGDKREYILRGESDSWSCITTIDKAMFEAMKDQIQIREENVEGYRLLETTYDEQSGVCTLTNQTEQMGIHNIKIQKRIKPADIDWKMITASFDFLLEGTTNSGKKVKEQKQIVFSKKDALQDVDSKGYVTKEIVFENLLPGSYSIEELGGENFYQTANIEGPVTKVEGNKAWISLGEKEDQKTYPVRILYTNEAKRGSIKLQKKSVAGQPLKEVCFVLFDQNHHEIIRQSTDEKGEVFFKNLKIGTYTIQEIKTTSGMQLLPKEFSVQIPTKPEGEKEYLYDLEYEIVNTPTLLLPKTGGAGTNLFRVTLFIGLYLMGIGFVIATGKSKRNLRKSH